MAHLRWLFLAVGGAACLALAGCGDSVTTIEGTASIKGTKLNHGRLVFHGEGGKTATAAISPGGTYQAVNPPTGQVKVTVEAENIKGDPKTPPPPKGVPMAVDPTKGGGGGGDAAAPRVPIPAIYKDMGHAETVTISGSSKQTIDINFTK